MHIKDYVMNVHEEILGKQNDPIIKRYANDSVMLDICAIVCLAKTVFTVSHKIHSTRASQWGFSTKRIHKWLPFLKRSSAMLPFVL